MARFESPDIACRVRTFKEGVLSAVAHDLLIDARSVTVDIDADNRVAAEIDAAGLHVVDAVVRGRLAPGKLSAKDKREIEANLRDKVLSARKHPAIRFFSEPVKSGDPQIRGRLELHGRSRQITLRFTAAGDRWQAELSLHQPDYGIKPFRAALGALKVKADIKIEIEASAAVVEALG